MTPEQIENFLQTNSKNPGHSYKIFFKTRNTVEGMFIKAPDYDELRKKNFWRVVATSRMAEYQQSKDMNLSRIFNGSEFTRLGANS